MPVVTRCRQPHRGLPHLRWVVAEGENLDTQKKSRVKILSNVGFVLDKEPDGDEATVDMGIFHTMRHLLHGVLDLRSVNQVNAEVLSRVAARSPS